MAATYTHWLFMTKSTSFPANGEAGLARQGTERVCAPFAAAVLTMAREFGGKFIPTSNGILNCMNIIIMYLNFLSFDWLLTLRQPASQNVQTV
jgi:hypothetical protein